MVATPLFESILNEDATTERSRRVAAHVVQAAIEDLARIEKLDLSLAPQDPAQFDRRTATLMRGEYGARAHDAKALLEQIDRYQRAGGAVAEAGRLEYAYGKTRARLSVSIDAMDEGMRSIAEGRVVSAAEVRRELRLRIR